MPSVRSVHARSAIARAGTAVRAAAFWAAVALPLAAITLLTFGWNLRLVGAVLALNAAALVVGHGYRTRPNRSHGHGR
ncbi:hypothetical protein [Haloplanus pelagicus]|jgi:hypothetical protein|uniref:hypothetical protein n=1 Tax=Haloplanus pelagicus TaxID=2949995 RepID=UPI00203D2D4E|nr:hypothetical protein [Haloplanus sp. HW8-1]